MTIADTIRQPNKVDVSLLVLLAFIWGSAFLAIKVVVPESGPLWLVTIRVAIAFAALAPFTLWRGVEWPVGWAQWALIALIALFNVIAPFFLISWAELTIDAGVTSLLMGVGPMLALIAAHFATRDDRMTGRKFFAVVLGFCGIAVVVGWEAFAGLGQNVMAQGAATLGAVSYVVSGVLLRRVTGISSSAITILVLGASLIGLLLLTLLLEGPVLPVISGKSWVVLVYLGLFPTALGYQLRYYLIRAIGQSYFTLSINLIPVFGIGLGTALLGEPLTLPLLIALFLILSGLAIARRKV